MVKLSFAEGNLTISAVSAETGRAVEEVEADYGGEPLEIGFNARYIGDILQGIGGETVRFEMASAAAPTVVRDPADASTLYVLMPMRV
jgi:DNA polymerase-3 subunit beta